ncbi:hypothetical protein [uncultured Vibrio sp.]|uniref:hypothetical protein n=1 Tax=uncultured Vibrio sp. TaxID=114054 RepID=UPI00263447F2|nr:hypothetical protein [uncultured Vibrio sp.]
MEDKMRLDTTMPWYYRAEFVLTLLFVIGPLALPLVWLSPALSRGKKGLITLAMGAFTWVSYQAWLDVAPLVDQIME